MAAYETKKIILSWCLGGLVVTVFVNVTPFLIVIRCDATILRYTRSRSAECNVRPNAGEPTQGCCGFGSYLVSTPGGAVLLLGFAG